MNVWTFSSPQAVLTNFKALVNEALPVFLFSRRLKVEVEKPGFLARSAEDRLR